MNPTQLYGELQSEKIAEEKRVAREIVQEINNFGINERQRWMIIYQLVLELENITDLQETTAFIKELKGSEIFLTGKESI